MTRSIERSFLAIVLASFIAVQPVAFADDPPGYKVTIPKGVPAVTVDWLLYDGFYPKFLPNWNTSEQSSWQMTYTQDVFNIDVRSSSAEDLLSLSIAAPLDIQTPSCPPSGPFILPGDPTPGSAGVLDVSALTAAGDADLFLDYSRSTGGWTRKPIDPCWSWIDAEPQHAGVNLSFNRYPDCGIHTPLGVTAKKTAQDTAAVVIDYQFPAGTTNRSLVLRSLAWTDAKGRSQPEQVVRQWTADDAALDSNGPFTANVSTGSLARQARFLAEANYARPNTPCEGHDSGYGAIECDTCNATVGDPVSVVDGNMRYVDADPLPPILERALTRTFDSGHGQDGFFGIGWTTMFDQTLNIVNNPAGEPALIHLTTADNETVAFYGDGSQVWPPNVTTPASLTYDGSTGGYVYRPAGGRYESRFDADLGFFAGLRDVVTGRELHVVRHLALGGVTITGMTVVDSWTGTTWEMTVENDLVTSMVATSGITWNYDYDDNAYLRAVEGPSGPWRTYTYGTAGLTEARDAAGKVLETHQYDSSGRAITSIGPSDEIANIEYDLPAPGGASKTRITTGGGAVVETILYPVGGAHRVIERNGGCSSWSGVRTALDTSPPTATPTAISPGRRPSGALRTVIRRRIRITVILARTPWPPRLCQIPAHRSRPPTPTMTRTGATR
jgi:Domain of unknown function (DUF6531)